MFLSCSSEQKAARKTNMDCFCCGVGSQLMMLFVFSRGSHSGIGERPGSSDLVCVDMSCAVIYALLLLLLPI